FPVIFGNLSLELRICVLVDFLAIERETDRVHAFINIPVLSVKRNCFRLTFKRLAVSVKRPLHFQFLIKRIRAVNLSFILTHFCFLTIYSIGEILLITVQSILINIRVHREIDEVEFTHSFTLLPFPVVLKRNPQRTIACFLTALASQPNIIGTPYASS